MEDAPSSPERSEPKRGLLCRGWRIGKKLAVAGAVVTSAPLVIPPLLFLSTVGLVCAVPVCVYLAAFAATERVMTLLLPIPSDEEQVLESKVEIEPLDMVFARVVKEKDRMDDDDDDDDDDDEDDGEERSLMDVERESLVENEKGELVVLTAEENASGDGESWADAAVKIENPILPIVHSLVGIEEINACPDAMREDGEESAMNNGKEEDANGEEVIVIVKELKTKKDEFLNVDAPEDQSSETADSESKISASTELVIVLPLDQTEAMDKDEGKYNEEKIWEEIYALRTIMGYQEALRMSCVEELAALYIFAGVEPPASAYVKDSPKLNEVNDMLLFLKSVIGVK